MKEGVVLLLFVLVGSSVSIFFTSSKQNDYPRIGRRSFYTSSKENTYPRIGRRSLGDAHSKQRHHLTEKRPMYRPSNGLTEKRPMYRGSNALIEKRAMYRGSNGLTEKRAMYTASNENSYPRIGRGVFTSSESGNSFPHVGRRKSPPRKMHGGDRSDMFENSGASSVVHLDPHLLSITWDLNGDGIISRKEFIEGFFQGKKRRK